MATLRGPSTTGSSLAAFLDAYQRERQLGQQEQAMARQNQLAALQAGEIIRKRTEEEGLTKALAALPTTPLEPYQPPMAAPTVEDTARMESAFTEPVAASPPPVSALTPQAVVQHLGPEQAARILGTERGRAAFGAMGGTTAEKFEQRKRIEEARAGLRRATARSMAARDAGDPLGAIAYEEAGLRSIMGAADDVNQVAQITKQIRELSEMREKIRKDTREEEGAKRAAPKIAAAIRGLSEARTENDPAKWSRAIESLGSVSEDGDWARKEAGRIFERVMPNLQMPMTEPGAQFMKLVSDESTAVYGRSFRLTPEQYATIVQRKASENPDLFFRAAYPLAKDGKLPAEWEMALFGRHTPKNEWDFAVTTVVAEGKDPNSPEGAARAMQVLREYHEMKRRPERPESDSQTRLDRRVLYREANAEIRQINKDITTLSSGFAAPSNKARIDDLKKQRGALVKRRDAIAAEMGAGNLPEAAEPGGDEPAKGRAATRQEYDAAKKAAGTDLNRFREILRARGIDPALPPGP